MVGSKQTKFLKRWPMLLSFAVSAVSICGKVSGACWLKNFLADQSIRWNGTRAKRQKGPHSVYGQLFFSFPVVRIKQPAVRTDVAAPRRWVCAYSSSRLPASKEVVFCNVNDDTFIRAVTKAWFPYDRSDRPDRPSRFKIFRDDPDDWGEW